MVPTTMVAADAEKGVVVKANASKASAKAATPKTTSESPKTAASVTKSKVSLTAAPVPVHKASKPGEAKSSRAVSTKAAPKAPAKAAPAKATAKAPAKAALTTAKAALTTAKAAPAKATAKAPVKAVPTTAKAVPAKATAKAPVKAVPTTAKAPPAAKAATSRSKAVAAPTTAAKKPVAPATKPVAKARTSDEVPVTKQAARTKAGSGLEKGSDQSKTRIAKAPSPTGKAKGGSAHAALGLGAKAAVAKRTGEGYSKDVRFLASQRTALMRERSTYLEQAASLKAEAEALVEEMEPGDIQFDDESGEGGTVTVDRERDLALSAQALAAVEEIDHTLLKLDNGTYGICENCGRTIVKARLEALPYARLCIDCKSGGLSKR